MAVLNRLKSYLKNYRLENNREIAEEAK